MTSRSDTTPPSGRPTLPRRWPWIALASVVVIGSMPWLACPRLKRWRARRDAGAALSGLSGCLFGRDGDPDAGRLRARLIATELQGPGPDTGWPARCNDDAAALQVALGALAPSPAELCEGGRCCPDDGRCAHLAGMTRLVDELRAALRSGDVPTGATTALFDHAAGLDLATAAAATATEPPAPARLFAARELTPLSRGRYDQRLTALGANDGLRVAFHRRARGVTLCDIQLDGATGTCFALAAAVPVGGQVLLPEQATEGPIHVVAEPTQQAGGATVAALYRATDGQRLSDLPTGALGSTVWHDGTMVTVARDEEGGRAKLVRQAADGSSATETELTAELSSTPVLEGDTLVWLTRAAGDDHRLRAARALASGPLLGEAQDVGSTGPIPGNPRIETCRFGDTLAVLVRGKSRGYDTAAAVALRRGDEWLPVARAQVPSPWFGLTCQTTAANLTWIEARSEQDHAGGPSGGATRPVGGEYLVARFHCSPAGCRLEQTPVPLTRWSRSSRYVTASLGGAVMVLWRSPRGDVRWQTGPLDELAAAPAQALFDDAAHGGFAWEQAGTSLIVRGSAALLLVEATSPAGEPETYGFVLDEQGTARPVTVTTAAP